MEALNALYSSGYEVLQRIASVEGIFVSDCGALFVRDSTTPIIERL
jgi:hypothetical protein